MPPVALSTGDTGTGSLRRIRPALATLAKGEWLAGQQRSARPACRRSALARDSPSQALAGAVTTRDSARGLHPWTGMLKGFCALRLRVKRDELADHSPEFSAVVCIELIANVFECLLFRPVQVKLRRDRLRHAGHIRIHS